LHAEQAYAELGTTRQQQICETLFKALTDKATDPRGVRRPTTLGKLCGLADATAAEVTDVIAVFRDPSRSFLMPPAGGRAEGGGRPARHDREGIRSVLRSRGEIAEPGVAEQKFRRFENTMAAAVVGMLLTAVL
jgi:hypothetical protein